MFTMHLICSRFCNTKPSNTLLGDTHATAQQISQSRAHNRLPTLKQWMNAGGTVGQKSFAWVMIFALAWGGVFFSVQPALAQGGYQIFIPSATNDAVIGLGGEPEPTACALNEQESLVAQFAENDPDQQRTNMICDSILSQVARAKARDMALNGYFSHTTPEGKGPNLLVREAGYSLPDWYSSSATANNIESIGAGYQTPDAAWAAWLNSQSHRTHVLGTQSFYAAQEAYGVGYYYNPDSEYKHYWVFISAPIAE